MSTSLNYPTQSVSTDLAPYTGPWEWQQASHLLRRASFGPTLSEINDAIANGMDNTVATLLAPLPAPPPPLNPSYADDPNVPIGETWVLAPEVSGVSQYRAQSFRSWLMITLQEAPLTVRDKMVLFWTNHFGMNVGGDQRVHYVYFSRYQAQATGNFRQLVKDMTIDVAMLRFLNGNQNRNTNPNENYARELLELFTIGKGPLAGPGDYTNYTEQDVAECARILTGWRTAGVGSDDPNVQPYSYFQESWHDTDDKTLSHRFDNVVVANANENEYANLVDIIFTKDEVARYICRKLYRFFVYYDIDATIETNIIEPLAQLMIDNDYEVAPVLEALFKSQHFYEISIAGDIVKDPLSFTVGIMRPTNWSTDFELALRYDAALRIFSRVDLMGLDLEDPPSVAGWPVWYQAPAYNRLWLNSSSLQRRTALVNEVSGNGIRVDGENRPFDWLAFIEDFSNPFDPNVLILDFTRIFLPQPLYQNQLDELKDFLIPGLPDFEWTDEYGLHLANPDDEMLRASVENKLKSLVRALFKMAEFHIS